MMTRSAFALLGLALVSLALQGCGGSSGTTSPTPTPSPTPSPNSALARGIVLRLQPGVDPAALAREYGLTLADGESDGSLYQFRQRDDDHEDRGSLTARMLKDPRFTDAEPDDGVRCPEGGSVTGDPIHVPFDFVGTSDSSYVSLSSNYGASTVNPNPSLQVGLSVSRSVRRSSSVTVAVLDTGVEASHPTLSGHLTTGYNAITPTAAPDDSADGSQNQARGHGTMVAGVIAQVAPDARIMPVRVLNADGTGTVFDVVRGLRWAVSHGASVVNLSFGTPTASRTLQNAIQDARKAGVVVVASAGNAGKEQRDYPAGFSDAIAVAAVDSTDQKSSFSNYGSHVALSAPGTAIRSTYIGGGFATWSGTSFAAPFVSGAAALVRAASPSLPADKVGDALTKSARSVDSVNPSYAGRIGKGVLNIPGALAVKP
ncbi:S8 family serine peptidase [Armatimonas rosea]|uniref:Subtilisin family serine protease n=1 Tax=Armatimonas rosea TaxID=685828 RepID=A0A7W9W887_ARMRO|nr:S8 family serine peptidase [Armatimonas rosea]MBB6051362.1 subtilisin family serine protease [Armatimonas rosea]